jgi:DNA-binding transcriptional LysR family regulator
LSSHPLASLDEIPIAALAEQPLILTKWGTSLGVAVNQAFEDAGIVVVPAYEVTYLATALSFAANGLGIALLSEGAVGNAVCSMGWACSVQAHPGSSRRSGCIDMTDEYSITGRRHHLDSSHIVAITVPAEFFQPPVP